MEDNIETPVQAPTNMEGVAIHLSYLRRDMQKITEKIDGISTNFVTLVTFQEHLKDTTDHETRIRDLEKALWKYIGASSIISSIISAGGLTLIQNFIK